MRLDIYLVEKNLSQSRERAQGLISAGLVYLDGKKAIKASQNVDENSKIEIKGNDIPYVGRGGLKLEKAIKEFNVDVKDKICVDIGASTGGFTDCLLQNGAKKVYAVDCGYGQLDWKLRNDPRVAVMERVNARGLKKTDFCCHPERSAAPKSEASGQTKSRDPVIQKRLPDNTYFLLNNGIPPLRSLLPLGQQTASVGMTEKINLIVIDVSFISLKLILPAAKNLLEDGYIIALIKPQFEVGKGEAGKGGIVRDEEKRKRVVEEISVFAKGLGFDIIGVIESPIKGAEGNVEYLIYLKK